jgi:hypothetical protein
MKSYREHHHVGKAENVERESGIKALRERREGLVNVLVGGDEGMGRIV